MTRIAKYALFNFMNEDSEGKQLLLRKNSKTMYFWGLNLIANFNLAIDSVGLH